MNPLYLPALPGLAAGVTAMTGCIVLFVLLQRRRLATEHTRDSLRSEFHAMLQDHGADCMEGLERVGRQIAIIESSAQNIERLTCGFSRPLRGQAIELMRSGIPPQKIAQELGIGRREVRLIAHVARVLAEHAPPA